MVMVVVSMVVVMGMEVVESSKVERGSRDCDGNCDQERPYVTVVGMPRYTVNPRQNVAAVSMVL